MPWDEIVSFVLGFGVPLAVSYFKATHWTDRQAMILSLVICAVAGAFSSIGTHALIYHTDMTVNEWLTNATVVFTAATAFYKIHFQTTQTNAVLEAKGPFEIPNANNADGTPVAPPTPPGGIQ